MNKTDTRTLLETSVVKQVTSLNWIFFLLEFFSKNVHVFFRYESVINFFGIYQLNDSIYLWGFLLCICIFLSSMLSEVTV